MAWPAFLNPRNPVLWIVGLVSGGAIVIGVTSYNAFFGPAATLLEEYTVPVELTALQRQVDASGTIVPVRTVNISPLQAGRLERLEVDQGMTVEAGQPLAVMKNDTNRAQGLQAEARFNQAVANLQETQARLIGQEQQLIEQLNIAQTRFSAASERVPAEALAAITRFQLAQQQLQRYEVPTEQGAISQNELEDVILAFQEARANLKTDALGFESLATQLSDPQALTQRLPNNPEIRELAASVREARAALDEHRQSGQRELQRLNAAVAEARAAVEERVLDVQDTVIRAPFAGIVTQKYATEGAFVTPTTSGSVATASAATSILALAEGLEVLAKIPEIDVSQVKPGQFVEIMADAYPNQPFRGRVYLVAPEAVVEENVTSFEVRIVIDPQALEELRLLSGMNVDVTFLGEQLSQTLVVPTVAIVTEAGETGVMVPDWNNRPVFRPVTIGSTIGDQTQILEGLEPGERVFIELPEQFRDRDAE